MGNMDGWDVALLVAAGYVAATALVRLMTRRRDQLLDEFHRELAKRKRRKDAERRNQRPERSKAA
ncbi:MAG TPA: hypothetical protein VMY42_25685 [Thermoguttaceae bacterium]|nr:hypothetical protein [Thermoguttaceae bacterium]